MNLRWKVKAAVVTVGSAALLAMAWAPVSAAAIVLHPDEVGCVFEPGDVPGVDVYFPGKCTIVISASGNTTIVGRGQLPDGYSVPATFIGTLPCFDGTGTVVVTTSGQVTATCHFSG